MKRSAAAQTCLTIIGIAAAIDSAANLHAQQIQVSGTNRTVSVTTSDEAIRRADIATVHIGFLLYATSSSEVNTRAGAASREITAALAQAGVAKDAVESDSQSTAQTQEYQNSNLPPAERAAHTFQAQQSWTVHISASNASQVLASAVAAGANSSGAIDWSIADEASLSAEAAGKALKHAQAIAEQMASGLGTKLGSLIFASNQATPLTTVPLNIRMYDGPPPAASASAAVEQNKLVLSAPMVHRSATVSAVFSLQ